MKKWLSPKSSQSELLESLHGEQRRAGIRLLDLNLVPVLHQRVADQFIKQRLFGQVNFVAISFTPFILDLVLHHVGCRWKQRPPRKFSSLKQLEFNEDKKY